LKETDLDYGRHERKGAAQAKRILSFLSHCGNGDKAVDSASVPIRKNRRQRIVLVRANGAELTAKT
jgi:hypothetical protein